MRKQIGLVVALVLLASLVTLSGVAAQDKVAITLGESVTGTITDKVNEVWYTFTGKAGELVTLEVVPDAEESTLDPTIELRNSDGQPIALNDDFSYPLALVIAELPTDGDYIAVVGRAGGVSGESTGDFDLRINVVEPVGPGSTIEASVNSDFNAPPLIYVMHPTASGPVELSFSQEVGENYAAFKVLQWSSDSYPDTLVNLDSTSKLSKATLTVDLEADNFYVLQLMQVSYSFSDPVDFPVTITIQ